MRILGLFCFTENSGGQRYGKMAVYNPTDRGLRVEFPDLLAYVPSSENKMLAHPGEAETTDRFRMGAVSRCSLQVRINKSEYDNQHLLVDYSTSVEGIARDAPAEASRQVVMLYFKNLENRDIEALQQYVDTRITVSKLAERIAWRTTVEVIQITTEKCVPKFQLDKSGSGTFKLVAWQCSMSAVLSIYSPNPGSAVWRAAVTQDLEAGNWVLTEERQQ